MFSVVTFKVGFVFLFMNLFNIVNGQHPVVETRLGKVKGTLLTSVQNNIIYAFRGIPYAKPPLKELRFKPPEPIARWERIHDATEDGHRCIQFNFLRNNMISGDEDCLLLNVYSPKLPPTNSLPVMVFIHGGGFFFGSGLSDFYGAERLLDNDVVLVTINYRLSALGFLSTGDSIAPGNYGLLDQVEALKWVRDNVASFGGNPDSVTIFGESAGGASVIFHLLSPLSKGLFHGAIIQSGSALSPWSLTQKTAALRQTELLAKYLNCPTKNSELIVNCLRRRAALDVLIKSSLFEYLFSKGQIAEPLKFLPVVDQEFGAQFLIGNPKQLLESGKINKVPVMIGICKDEGFLTLQVLSGKSGGIEKIYSQEAITMLKNEQLDNFVSDANMLSRLVEAYLSGIEPTDNLKRINALSDLFADVFINQGTDETISAFATHNITTYAFMFTHNGKRTVSEFFMANRNETDYLDKLNITTHLDELRYLFKVKVASLDDLNEEDSSMSDIMLTLWTNFARNKVPSLKGDNVVENFKWNPVLPNKPSYMALDLEPTTRMGPFCSRPELWKSYKLKDEL